MCEILNRFIKDESIKEENIIARTEMVKEEVIIDLDDVKISYTVSMN